MGVVRPNQILICTAPYLILIFTYTNKSKVFSRSPQFYEKFGTLYEEFKLEKGFWSSQFYFIYFLRRLSYMLFQMYLNSNLVLQGALNISFSLSTLLYLLHYMPFKDKVLMKSNLIGEFCVNLVFIFSYILIFDISAQFKSALELCIIFTVILGILGQFIISFYLFIKGITELWTKMEKARALQFADTAKKTIPELIEGSCEHKMQDLHNTQFNSVVKSS